MLHAAYTAGQAINLTKTTAGHAMCYKLTSLYKLPHGQAAALCVNVLWPYMLAHPELCIDPRGEAYLQETYKEIAAAYGCADAQEAAGLFRTLLSSLELPAPEGVKEEDFELLKHSVNVARLKNHPVKLDEETIEDMYREMLR